MNEFEQIFVEPGEEIFRLDQILAKRFKERYSRTYFQKLIESNLVLVNGKPAKKRLRPALDDEIEVEFTQDPIVDILPENIPLSILYEDEDILVVNKQAGLVLHPAPGNWTGTFVNALVYHCRSLENEEGLRPGIVHRLDKDTTGVLIAAKNSYAQSKLIESFSQREVGKVYLAIAVGNPGNQQINAPIGRHPHFRQKMAVVEKGRNAETSVETLLSKGKLSFVKVKIKTGRTHQIRVHLSFIGTPVLGDSLYGSKGVNESLKAKRQMLHASELEIIHPRTLEKMIFHAPPPEDFQHFRKQL